MSTSAINPVQSFTASAQPRRGEDGLGRVPNVRFNPLAKRTDYIELGARIKYMFSLTSLHKAATWASSYSHMANYQHLSGA